MKWFVFAVGRGTALVAHVVGPYGSLQEAQAANPGGPGETVTAVGNQSGYATQLEAQQEVNVYNSSSVSSRVSQAGGTAAGNPLNLLPSPLDIFKGLNLGNILMRMGEIILGVVLIGVGIAKLTGTTNMVATLVKAKIP